MMRVSAVDFIRNYGTMAAKALSEPVAITSDGRDRLVMISAEEYQRLKRRDRRVFDVGELSAAQVAALQTAEVPAEYGYLDAELAEDDMS